MNITQLAMSRDRVTLVALAVVLMAGLAAYQSMPRNEDPGFIIRTALVQTLFPGASPERVEQLVTDKLEEAIQEMPELDYVSSDSKAGVSVIYVNVKESYTQMRPIWDKLRRKVDSAQSNLPDDVIGPFVNDEFGDVFGTVVSVVGEGFSYRELEDIAEEVRDELLLIDNVAKVEIFGTQEERIFVEYDNARLAELGLSPVQLQSILTSRNIILPGGDLITEYEKLLLEPSGNFQTLDELGRTIVNVPGSNDVIRLQDIVAIERGYVDPPEELFRYNGEPGLSLHVSLREGGNVIDLGEDVRRVVERARSVYPIGVEFELLLDQAQVVQRKVDEFTGSLVQAVLIVAAVMLVFLGLRTGLIVASLIPAAMISALLIMSTIGVGLDQMSLAALIIALGMLVDNAIVMTESVMVRMGAGESAWDASLNAAAELRLPLLISSLTTSAAFLPIYLAESSTGEYTAPLFIVVTITLLCSWVLALTMVPLLCSRFLRIKVREEGTDPYGGPFYGVYRALLLLALRHRFIALGLVGAVWWGAMQGFAYVPNIFFPDNDRPQFTAEVELPNSAPIERMDALMQALDDFVRDRLSARNEEPGITQWGTFVGAGAPKFLLPYNPEPASPNYAMVLGEASSVEQITARIVPELEDYLENEFPDANPTIRPLPLGAPAWPPVSIRLSGRDTEELFRIADALKGQLEQVAGARQVTDDWGPRSKKLQVGVDETRARLAGVTNQDVALSLQTALDGLETTEYREADELIPVILRSRGAVGSLPKRGSAVPSVNVYAQSSGRNVPLDDVATVRLVWEPAIVRHRDRLRTVAVEALLVPGYTASEVNAAISPWLEEQAKTWPFGYAWEFGGEAETSGTANASIAAKLPIAGLIILLLLVAQFNSLRRPLIVLITIPLGLIGVVAGLLIARSYVGFMTLLGIISLAGIVINNAIVLLDRIRIETDEQGLSPADAVLRSAQTRLRPILLTTVTTVGGLLPLWLSGGPMWEPMAISIIFGLLFATVLTLGVVPLLYSLFFGVSFKRT
ncbi:MAG: efflux RND transporter permease subunit [Pseudomonadota bacterium]